MKRQLLPLRVCRLAFPLTIVMTPGKILPSRSLLESLVGLEGESPPPCPEFVLYTKTLRRTGFPSSVPPVCNGWRNYWNGGATYHDNNWYRCYRCGSNVAYGFLYVFGSGEYYRYYIAAPSGFVHVSVSPRKESPWRSPKGRRQSS